MYLVRVDFEVLGKRDDEGAVDAIYSYLSVCRNSGQINSNEWPITFSENIYSVQILLPERNSLSRKYYNKYAKKYIDGMKEKGFKKPKITVAGREIESLPTGKVESNDWFLLFTHFLSLESPVFGGNDFKPIPLYQLPKIYGDDYYDILSWKSDYVHCDYLQMCCGTGERFGCREMSNINSSLTKRGIEVCNKLTELFGKPFYYYLYKGTGRSLNKERERVCPGCGSGDWLLDEPLLGKFDFKCDKCRLLSNIAWDVR